ALVGLVTTPVAVVLTGVGAARLAESAPSRGGGDTLGIALLVLGVLVLAAVAVLGSWSSAAPVVGGLVWGVVVGAAAVVSPRRFSEVVEELGAAGAPAATEQLVRSATGGLLLVVGTLLLATGTATAIARRVGRRTTLDAAEAEAEATAAPAGGRTDARGTGT
ncbi:hypothetical protein Q9R32_16515, partial [Actinotalea sp. AC32]|nr:hypothetical protein [Actinotalea sp. AC32]